MMWFLHCLKSFCWSSFMFEAVRIGFFVLPLSYLISLLMASSCSCSMMARVCTSVCPLGDSNSEPKRWSPSSSSSEQPTSKPGSNPLPSRAPLSQSGYCRTRRRTLFLFSHAGGRVTLLRMRRTMGSGEEKRRFCGGSQGCYDSYLGGILSRRAPTSPVTPPDHATAGGAAKGIQVRGGARWEGSAPVGIPQLQSATWQRATGGKA